MALQMKASCERCGNATPPDGDAFICSFECTYCRRCGLEMDLICPNCHGELVARPRRRESVLKIPKELAILAGYSLAQGAWSVCDVAEDLVPFSVVEQGSIRRLIRLGAFSHEEAVNRSKAHLMAAQEHLDRWALCYETITLEPRMEMITIDLWDQSDSRSISLLQAYRPFSQQQRFQLLEGPKLFVDHLAQTGILLSSFLEDAEIGIAAHPEAASRWDEWKSSESVNS